jgi:polyhydroxybutyrate depolymerase
VPTLAPRTSFPTAVLSLAVLAAACSGDDIPPGSDGGPAPVGDAGGLLPALGLDAGLVGPGAGGGGGSGSDGGPGASRGDAAESPVDADATRPDASPGSDAATACARCTGSGDWTAGDYPPDVHAQTYLTIRGVPGQGDSVRGYKVHVPPSYRPDVGMPLLFAIHGLGQNAVMYAVDGAQWPAKADSEGFILVMPNGNVQNADGSWGVTGSWNAGECCGGAAQNGVDDVALIRAILGEVGKHVNVDLSRVYATGFSNGGFLSFRLACEAADLFTAIAPAAGAVGSPTLAPMGVGNASFTVCKPSAKVPVLALHGDADSLVPYRYMKPSLDLFAAANGCSTSTAPASQPASGGDTTCVSYGGCPSGVEVTGCTVAAGGHCWFGSSTCGTGVDVGNLFVGNNSDTLKNTDAAWAFLKRFARP